GADDAPGATVDDGEGSARFERLAKEFLEDILLIAVSRGMLFPDRRIRRHRVQIVKIFRSERPELEERACQRRLKFESHLTITRMNHGRPRVLPLQAVGRRRAAARLLDDDGGGADARSV